MIKVNRKINHQKGFTLLEMIVALGVFAVCALIAVGGFVSVVESSKKTHSNKVVINNVNYSIESMVREMRTGKDYFCYEVPNLPTISGSHNGDGEDCGPSDYDANDLITDRVLYLIFNTNRVDASDVSIYNLYRYKREGGIGRIEKAMCTDDNGCGSLAGISEDEYIRITPENLNVDFFDVINRTDPNDGVYAKIIFHAFSGDKTKEEVDIGLETIITPRI